ncbi:MAG: hypothetical protein IPO21_14065 [Bacteroidales bacterium]|nr:hypothetical protein [Bacteroidales bacterium]
MTNVPNIYPSVSITAPLEASVIGKGELISVSASATDTDGLIAALYLLADGTPVDTFSLAVPVATINHSFSWICKGVDATQVAVVALDNRGGTDTSMVTIQVTDPNPTNITFVSPAVNSNINFNLYDIVINAIDDDEGILSATFYINGVSIGASMYDGDSRYSTQYLPIAPGPIQVTVVVTNGAGLTVTQSLPLLTVSNAIPVCSISLPVTPFVLPITHDTTFVAQCSDPDGTITSVSFYLNGSSTPILTDNTPTDGFTFTYQATAVGSFALAARATDNRGAQSTLNSVSFTVAVPSASAYVLESVKSFCSSAGIFCLPVVATTPISNILGFDIDILYDNTKVTQPDSSLRMKI